MPSILGGGISGLAAAHYLIKRNVNPITLYEASNRVGGWIRSEQHQDFIFEYGPRTIRPFGPAAPTTFELIEEVGLAGQVKPILSDHPAVKNRMIYVKNKLCTLPNKITSMFRTVPPFTKPLAAGLFVDLKTKSVKQKSEDESIYNFVERRFGSEIAEYAISSMICGICAGDAKEISVRFLMNDIFENEQKYGGVVMGLFCSKLFGKKSDKKNLIDFNDGPILARIAKRDKWSIYSLEKGLQELPEAVLRHLNANLVNVQTNTECEKITFTENNAIVHHVKGEDKTDQLISALPSYKLAELVESNHPELSNLLKEIEYVDVAVVNLQYDGDLLKEKAFGFLVPPVEKLPILGIIFDSCCFDIKDKTVLTVMMGGKWFKEHFGTNPKEDDILNVAVSNIKRILKIEVNPEMKRVSILRKCIPQYTVGHSARVKGIRDYIKKNDLPLVVCGSAYDGVGVNDVILSAKSQVIALTGY